MREIEQFLYREAALLDSRDFPGWLKLFAPDALYWIPSNADEIDPSREVSIVYDDAQFLAERVWRLDSGLAYAQEPRSRTSHVVGNVQASEREDGRFDVDATFLVAEFRRGEQHLHAGRYRYELRREDDDFLIGLKKVELINNDGHLGNLSLLL